MLSQARSLSPQHSRFQLPCKGRVQGVSGNLTVVYLRTDQEQRPVYPWNQHRRPLTGFFEKRRQASDIMSYASAGKFTGIAGKLDDTRLQAVVEADIK
jgi:hypothetical protein